MGDEAMTEEPTVYETRAQRKVRALQEAAVKSGSPLPKAAIFQSMQSQGKRWYDNARNVAREMLHEHYGLPMGALLIEGPSGELVLIDIYRIRVRVIQRASDSSEDDD